MSESAMARTMACSMPTKTTVAAVRAATVNSPVRTRAMARMPAMSMSSTPMSMTTAARTALGMYCSAGVKKRSTARTTTPVVTWASWLLPPAPSTICVLVGLPLTIARAREPRAEIGRGEADQVDVLVEAVAVLDGVGARGRGALGEDDDEAGEDRRHHRHDVVHVDDPRRQADGRQASLDRAQESDRARQQAQVADEDHAQDRDEGARDATVDAPAAEDDDPHADRDEERGDARVRGSPGACRGTGQRHRPRAWARRARPRAASWPPGCRRPSGSR